MRICLNPTVAWSREEYAILRDAITVAPGLLASRVPRWRAGDVNHVALVARVIEGGERARWTRDLVGLYRLALRNVDYVLECEVTRLSALAESAPVVGAGRISNPRAVAEATYRMRLEERACVRRALDLTEAAIHGLIGTRDIDDSGLECED